MTTDEFLTERRGNVLIGTLNRPDARNALTPGIINGLGAAVLEAESAVDVRCLLITGAGDRAFCAGMDLKAFAGGTLGGGVGAEESAAFQRFFKSDVAVPVVAAANGPAVAGGMELLLACDVIVLADHAKLGLPEVKRGLFAALGGTFLGTRIPLGIALELLLTGDYIEASRAAAVGLANAVVPGDQLLDTALGYADKIAANAPLALKATKELARLALVDDAAARAKVKEYEKSVFASQDAKEGAIAFLERRTPNWTGA